MKASRLVYAALLGSCASLQLVATPQMTLLTAPPRLARARAARADEAVEEEAASAGHRKDARWQDVREILWPAVRKADLRIEGGGTQKTFQMPKDADRVQYILTSPSGRPVMARVEMWVGPSRCVHTLVYDCMNGGSFPIRATLGFEKGVAPVLKISTYGPAEFPLQCGVFVPSAEQSEEIDGITENVFDTAPMRSRVHGGSTMDAAGEAQCFPVDHTWEKTQFMAWSKNVGKKSFESYVEFLQGPSNAKLSLYLHCGDTTQPFHAVVDTPGSGWMIRCNSQKPAEDGLFEMAVAPYERETGDRGRSRPAPGDPGEPARREPPAVQPSVLVSTGR